jgi:membrane associated rhomboid family serine protease
MQFFRKPFRYRVHNVVFILIGINVLVFIAELGSARLFGGGYIPLVEYFLSMNPGLVKMGWVWQFVTYMFVHGGWSHLLFNMLALFMFGLPVERRMGSSEFLLYYFVTGIAAGLFSFAVYLLTGQSPFLMGASGALFAVQLAYACFFPQAVILIFGLVPLRAPIAVLLFTGIELVSAGLGGGGNVAHLTHLAGFGAGWLYFLVRFGVNPWRAMRGRWDPPPY